MHPPRRNEMKEGILNNEAMNLTLQKMKLKFSKKEKEHETNKRYNED